LSKSKKYFTFGLLFTTNLIEMDNSVFKVGFYPHRWKIVGYILLALGILIFLIEWGEDKIIDTKFSAMAFGLGMLNLYFSANKVMDERVIALKFKALSSGFLLTSSLVVLIGLGIPSMIEVYLKREVAFRCVYRFISF
jgi:uncharacterized membrane protein